MKKILITGSGGLIGSEASLFYLNKGYTVIGVDNDMRQKFFGKNGSVRNNIESLKKFENYIHCEIDIRCKKSVFEVFKKYQPENVIHCAAQPSHDKATQIPFLDFEVNANATLNLLVATHKYSKNSGFVHVSTNKVYGDKPNSLKLKETEKRFDFQNYKNGIDESLSVDQSKHSFFGASKLAGDIIAQEFGRYYDMNVGVFRGGCLTGPNHAGVELHGFLSYIVKCAMTNKHYTIFGYKGKQVRDQIHSYDVISAFDCYLKNPRPGEVYNIGGEKDNSASILEIIDMIEKKSGKKLDFSYSEENRIGDHICYYTDMTKFKSHYPDWKKKYNLESILDEILEKYY